MATRIQLRRDTAANWTEANPILAQGEVGIETDVANKVKIGDGSTAWNSLDYLNTGASTFLGLTDTPSDYTGQAGKFPKVNVAEDALEFIDIPGGGDMLKSVYDPTSVKGDAFDMDNMAQGATKKYVSASELSVLTNIDGLTPASSLMIGDGVGDWTTVTPANFITDNNIITTTNTKTLTNKTLTSPVINSPTGIVTNDVTESTDKKYVTDAEKTVLGNTSGTNTGDQDLSSYATKANVLEKDNTTAFTPDADYEPATKKYVDDNVGISNIVEDITPQLGGELDCQANSIGFTLQTATGDGTTTIDWTNGNKFKFTFGAQNETFTFTAPSKPCAVQLILVQDGTGSRTATRPATVKRPGGTAPTLTTDANAVDIVSFLYDETNYYGSSSLDFS